MRISTALVVAVAVVLLESQETSAFIAPASPSTNGQLSSSSTRLFALEPLAKESDWAAYLDEDNTGLVYYFNVQTGESRWEPPTPSFPTVRIPFNKRKLALKKQMEYSRKVVGTKEEKEKGGGFFASVFSSSKEQEVKEEEPRKQEKPDWFDVASSSTTAVEEPKKGKEAKQAKAWFDFDSDRPKAADRPVMVEKKKKPKEEAGGIFSFIGGTEEEKAVEEKKKVEKKEKTKEQEPINGDATVKEKKPFFLKRLVAGKPAVQEKEQTTVQEEADKEEPKEEKGRGGFGLGKVMGALRSSSPSQQVEITPRKTIQIDMGMHVLPHPAKISWGGEDAAFTKGKTFGVFDGVSGADKLDGIPLYSKTLADELKFLIPDEDEGLNTKQLTKTLTEAAEFADKSATGASTALVASITPDNYLRVLNLGDSVCLVVRDNAIKARTREIVHYFDCPYQLAEDSPDRPVDGTKLNVEVLPGDLILMGSDGVFDNLDDQVLLETVQEAGPDVPPTVLARRIVDLSRKVSLDAEAETPYAKEAKRNRDPDYKSGKGGKVDDASLVVVRCA